LKAFLRSESAQSEVLGHAIILGITVLSVGAIVLYGVPTLMQLQHLSQFQQTQHAFILLASRVNTVALGSEEQLTAELNLHGGSLYIDNSSWIGIRGGNKTDISHAETWNLTSIVYTLHGKTIAYEGGGIWISDPTGGQTMLSPPQFNFKNNHLNIPIITINGSSAASGKGLAMLTARKKDRPGILYPTSGLNFKNSNPLPLNGNITLTLHSNYCKPWKTYLETITNNTAQDDCQQNKTLKITIQTPNSTIFNYAIAGTDEDRDNPVISLRQRSSVTGNIRTNGNTTITDRSTVNGELLTRTSQGSVHIKNATKPFFETLVPLYIPPPISHPPPVTPWNISNFIYDVLTTQINSTNNDNSNTTFLNGTVFNKSDDSKILSAGNYFFTNFSANGTSVSPLKLTFNTTNGDINIALDVSSPFELKNSSLEVKGNNKLNFYLGEGAYLLFENVDFTSPSPDQVTIFAYSGDQLNFTRGTKFHGTIYAPGAVVNLTDVSEFKGAVIAGRVLLQNSYFYYYEPLGELKVQPWHIRYLYVSRSQVEVEIR